MTSLLDIVTDHLVGHSRTAKFTAAMAIVLTTLTGVTVAVLDAFGSVGQVLPTWDAALTGSRTLIDGWIHVPVMQVSVGGWFFVLAGGLIGLAFVSAYRGAGVVPVLLLAGGPVAGWAINALWTGSMPHYPITYPLEMAVLYGGVFGGIGYQLGKNCRRRTLRLAHYKDLTCSQR